MSRSDRFTAIDWRGWLALAWVVWFGLLYGKMIVERRGDKVRAAVSGLTAKVGGATATR